MSDTTRKIFFEVDSGNVLSTFNQLKQIANETGRSLIENANKSSDSGEQIINSLNREINLRRTKRDLEVFSRKEEIKQRFEEAYSTADTKKDRIEVRSAYKGRLSEVKQDERMLDKQTLLLKDIVETLKQTSREEIKEDRSNVEKQVQLYKQGKLKDLAPEQEAKLKIQSEMLGEGKGGKSGVFSGAFWGSLLGNVIPGVIGKLTQVGMAQDSEQAVASLTSAIPIVGDLAAATQLRSYQARMDLEVGKYGFMGVGGSGNYGVDKGSKYGYTTAELYGLGTDVSRGRGSVVGVENVLDIAALEKAYNLDKGQLLGVEKGQRFGGGGSMKEVGTIVSALKKEDLYSQVKIPEYLQMLVSLQEEQIKVTGNVDSTRNVANIVAMSKLGDKYVRDGSYVTGISNALANPQNEYQQARSLSVLTGIKPGASLWELQLMQEKGIEQEGYMSGVLKSIKSRYGAGTDRQKERSERALYETLKSGGANISKQSARDIFQAYLKEPGMWDTEGNVTDEILQKFGVSTRQMGGKYTSEKQRETAEITEGYTQGALPGLATLLETTFKKITDNLNDAADNLGKKLGVSEIDRITNETIGSVIPGISSLNTTILNLISAIGDNGVDKGD